MKDCRPHDMSYAAGGLSGKFRVLCIYSSSVPAEWLVILIRYFAKPNPLAVITEKTGMKLTALLLIFVFTGIFASGQLAFNPTNRLMLSINKEYVSADSLMKYYEIGYHFQQERSPSFIQAETYYTKENEIKLIENRVYVRGEFAYMYGVNYAISIKQKATQKKLFITNIPHNNKTNRTVIHVAFKEDTLDYRTEVGLIDLKYSEMYLSNGELRERGTTFFPVKDEQIKLLLNSHLFVADTICDGLMIPGVKSRLIYLNRKNKAVDSLAFVLVFEAPLKYSKEIINHNVRYIPEIGLDIIPEIEFFITYSGNVSKKTGTRMLLLKIPPVYENGLYQVKVSTLKSEKSTMKVQKIIGWNNLVCNLNISELYTPLEND